MKKIIFILAFQCLCSQWGVSQSFQWTLTSHPYTSRGSSIIKKDHSNNVIVITQYGEPTSAGMYQYLKYALLSKYNISGTLLSRDTLRNYYVYDFAVSTDNSIYLTGYINEDTAYVANLTLTNFGGPPYGTSFIVRYFSNTNAGIIDHSKDSTGVLYNGQVVGLYSGANNSLYLYGSRNIANDGSKLFLAKYDPSAGYIFNSQVLNAAANQFCPGLAQDSSGNLYMAGILEGTAQFGATALSGNKFLAICDSSGNFTAATTIAGIQYASYAADPAGNIYLTGCPSGNPTTYLYKYNNAGILQWTKSFPNSGPGDVFADQAGNVYLTGSINSDGGAPQFDSYTLNGFGMYFIKFNPSDGRILWLQSIVNPGFYRGPIGTSIFSDGVGNIYTGGGYSDTTQFGATTLYSISAYPGPTGYLAKISDNEIVTNTKEFKNKSGLVLYPNPTQGVFTINYSAAEKGKLKLSITDSNGGVIYTETIYQFNGEFKKEIDLSNKAKGVYFIEVVTDGKKEVRRVVVE